MDAGDGEILPGMQASEMVYRAAVEFAWRHHHRSRSGDGAANMGAAVLSALDNPMFQFKIVR